MGTEHLPIGLRKQIKHEQGCKCGLCGELFKPKELNIHHIKPFSHHKKEELPQSSKRENLVALCSPCHSFADELALEHDIYLSEFPNNKLRYEVNMSEGIEYVVNQVWFKTDS